ncbi:MAG: membrane protein insertase YidC [Acutalibacteraceae bacterium]|nr:membrane protein insertase YidC [Acutalibacteraceae bacterium]
MDFLTDIIAYPLGYVMALCHKFFSDYGFAIIIFTLITKIILLPLAVWVQKNSIKMVQMQPSINRIKAKYFGDADSIADEEAKLYKQYKYNPLASIVPLLVQIVLLMGVVAVIYKPFNYLFNMDAGIINEINQIASRLSGVAVTESSIQLTAIEYIKNPQLTQEFASVVGIENYLQQIIGFDLKFFGINLSYTPSIVWGITSLVPVVAGLSSFWLCIAQNMENVLQAEQSKFNQWSMLALSVGLSLYLGFFVPAGIALYWIASNLFAIAQLYLLNMAIPPKKYVDYDALEESREELAQLNSMVEKKKLFSKDENAKRERADYKRFFSIRNKHLVFYSERSGFYKYYKEIVEYILAKTTVAIHYITNDPNDIVFDLAKENPQLKPYYIGVKKCITLMMRMEADVVVMTTPDLDNFYLKRSLMDKGIKYIFVPHDPSSMHMGFREHSLDNFDAVFCTGPHIAEEVRASEKLYGTKEKELIEFGYPLIENLISSCEALEENTSSRKQILIAPSWQEDNLLDSCIEPLIDSLYGDDYKIIVRPHPEYMKRYKAKMDMLVEKYTDKIGDGLQFELDFSSNTSVYSSDLLVTDWSGIGIEFGFATLKPVVFINTKIKMENENYKKIGIEPQEILLRNVLGVALEKDEIKEKFSVTVNELIGSEDFKEKLRKKREEYFYNLGSGGVHGAKYIIRYLIDKKKEKEKK